MTTPTTARVPSSGDSTASPRFSLVIPAFNEEANVAPVLEETLRVLDAAAWAHPYEIVFVNDGSRDQTGAVAESWARGSPAIRVTHHAANRGFGGALKTGFRQSRGEYVSFISADGEIGVDQALGLLKIALESNADLVTSKRLRENIETPLRKLLTWGFTGVSRLILGFDFSATEGIYAIRGDLLRSLPLSSDTGLVNVEVFIWCSLKKSIIRTGTMQARPRLSGKSKVTNLRTIGFYFWEMFKLRLALNQAHAGRER
jgi:glycosyltransferase involved in cell wall biosynthesis